jgi:hypothetical protein
MENHDGYYAELPSQNETFPCNAITGAFLLREGELEYGDCLSGHQITQAQRAKLLNWLE